MDTRAYLTRLALGSDKLLIPIRPHAITFDATISEHEWIAIVRTELVPVILRQFKYSRSRSGFALSIGRLQVAYAIAKGKLWWLLKDEDKICGAGTLKYFPNEALLSEDRVAIFQEHLRGRRIYPRILRKLSHTLRVGIDSDTTFIGPNILRLWKRTGIFLPERGRFHLRRRNPAPRLVLPTGWPFGPDGLRALLSRMATDPVRAA